MGEGRTGGLANLWDSEDNLWWSAPFFHCVDPEDQPMFFKRDHNPLSSWDVKCLTASNILPKISSVRKSRSMNKRSWMPSTALPGPQTLFIWPAPGITDAPAKWILGTQIQVFRLLGQVPLPSEPSPNPLTYISLFLAFVLSVFMSSLPACLLHACNAHQGRKRHWNPWNQS